MKTAELTDGGGETGRRVSPELRRLCALLLSAALGAAAYALPLTTTPTGAKTLAVSIFVIALFITEPVPFAISGLSGCLLFWFWVHMPAERAFSGFARDTAWFILGTLFMAQMAEKTGIVRRMACHIICRSGVSYPGILAGMTILNFLLTPLIPGMAKTILLCTISLGMIEVYGVGRRSNIGRGLILTMTYQSALFDKVMIAGASMILTRGFIESIGKVQVGWGMWLLAFAPVSIGTALACWWLTLRLFPPEKHTLEGGAEYCRAELARMGPISTDEIKALVIMGLAVVLWATDVFHHINASIIGVAFGLISCMPVVGVLDGDDIRKINYPVVIFVASAICLGNVMAETEVLKQLTGLMFRWMTPVLHAGSALGGLLLYWYANLFHLFLGNEISLLAATMPPLMQFSLRNGLRPETLGMIWGFAAGGKVFVYQSGVLAAGYAFGSFTPGDLFRYGLALFFVESLLLLVAIPFYWPLLGLTFR